MSFIGTKEGCVAWLMQQDGGRFEVRPKRKSRSLTANAYYWSLLGKLSRALGMPDSEVHARMLREWGSSEAFTVRADVPLEGYFRYFDVVGERDGYRTVRAYKGSSQMDSAEFSRLLSGMREECEAQGIQTMTPQEIAALEHRKG